LLNTAEKVKNIIKNRFIIIDGAMGTQLQSLDIPKDAWIAPNGTFQEGCNELLNITAPDIVKKVYKRYCLAGADMIKTNTFGSMDWVLDEYGLSDMSYQLSKLGASLAKEVCNNFNKDNELKLILGSIGPGTKLPSLGAI